MFPANSAPLVSATDDGARAEVGTRFTVAADGVISALRFYKDPSNVGPHVGSLWTTGGALIAQTTFTNETASGWQQVLLPAPVAVTAGQSYVVSYHTNTSGNYSSTEWAFVGGGHVDSGPLHALADSAGAPNGVFRYGSSTVFPSASFHATNYFVDAVFSQTGAADTVPPAVIANKPLDGATGAGPLTKPSATFSEEVQPATIGFALRDDQNNAIAGSLSYVNRNATFTPAAPLTPDVTYTATLTGVQDLSGNTMAPFAWSFTAGAVNTACPCSLWSDATVPNTVDDGDGNAVELGVKFTSDIDGWVSGVRFFKSLGNTGVHTGSVWDSAGTRLATVTFSNESSSGWQEVSFSSPVAVSAGTTYIVSYHTTVGHYSADQNYFTSALDRSPLHAPSDVEAGGNGVYRYGAGGFPNQTFASSNYWVDPVFLTSLTPGPPGAPGDVTAVGGDSAATVTWSAPGSIGSQLSSYTVTPYVGIAAGTPVDVVGSPPATSTTVTGLTNGVTYTFRVTATNGSGTGPASIPSNAVTPAPAGSGCPCSLFPASAVPGTVDDLDSSAIELGVKFTSDIDGFVSGVRFFKSLNNTGTHTGSLWDAAGTQLATATFTSESSSGWQEVQFSTPVAVTAGAIYVASYHTDVGHYSSDTNYFNNALDAPPLHAPASSSSGGNGVYRVGASGFPTETFSASNYWVDPVFTTSAVPTEPGTPTNVTAVAGDGQATVSWTAPSPHGSALTSYTVTPFVGATAGTPVTVSGTPPLSSSNVTGLTNGTTYTFTVSATNAVGTGPTSAASNAVTPAALPDAPANVIATRGDGQATVIWTAPASNGSPLTSYSITPFLITAGGGTALTPVVVTGSPPATSAVVTGLTNGANYTFAVTATNGSGRDRHRHSRMW